jgi:hypothetical protein
MKRSTGFGRGGCAIAKVSVASKSKTRKPKARLTLLRIVKFIASLLSSFKDEEKNSHENT